MTTPAPTSSVRGATPEDWDGIAQLLTDRHLPTAGAREHLSAFVVATRGRALVGCAGVERYGGVGLLRSGGGIGKVGGVGGGGGPWWAARGSNGTGTWGCSDRWRSSRTSGGSASARTWFGRRWTVRALSGCG